MWIFELFVLVKLWLIDRIICTFETVSDWLISNCDLIGLETVIDQFIWNRWFIFWYVSVAGLYVKRFFALVHLRSLSFS